MNNSKEKTYVINIINKSGSRMFQKLKLINNSIFIFIFTKSIYEQYCNVKPCSWLLAHSSAIFYNQINLGGSVILKDQKISTTLKHGETFYCHYTALNPCHAEQIMMPCPLLISSKSDHLIQVFDRNSHI